MKSLAVAMLVILVVAAGADAGSITVTADYSTVSPGLTGRIFDIPHFPTGVNTRAGVFNFLVTAADAGSGLVAGQSLKAFDLEMQFINPGNNVYMVEDLENAPVGASPGPNPGDTMGALRADLLRNLWFQHPGALNTTDSLTAAAFQLAVWTIVYDPVLPVIDLDVVTPHAPTNPGFWATGFTSTAGDAKTLANLWMSNLDPNGPKEMSLLALVDPDSQDFMFLGPQLPPQGFVPLPASLWMGLAMLSGLAAARVRRRRQCA